MRSNRPRLKADNPRRLTSVCENEKLDKYFGFCFDCRYIAPVIVIIDSKSNRLNRESGIETARECRNGEVDVREIPRRL